VYGPVRTVVWEGSSRKARPYPDPSVKRRDEIRSVIPKSHRDG
jgi:hypothetical protein